MLRTVVRFDQFLSVLVTNVDLKRMLSKPLHWIICHIQKSKVIVDCVHNKEVCYKSTMNIDLWCPQFVNPLEYKYTR